MRDLGLWSGPPDSIPAWDRSPRSVSTSDTAFSLDSLEANRAGALSPEQSRSLEANATYRSKGLVRHLLHSRDAFAQDVANGVVAATQGAISKKISHMSLPNEGGATAPPSFLIWVANREMGNQEFHSASDLHDAAPHAGIVRLFYLPQSKWAVNFEVLQVEVAADLASGSDGRRLLLEWNAARRAHDEVGEGVALAKMQAIGQAFVEKQPLAGDPVEPDEVRAAVVGGWQSPGLKVTVRDDGTLSATLGAEPPMAGRWEVDPSGRVAASVPGVAEQVDASVIGGRLTLVIAGQTLRLERAPD